jgi:hypothetical protein
MGLAPGFSANLLNERGRHEMGQQQSGDQHGRWLLLSLLPIDPRDISLPEHIARGCLASFLAIPRLSR